MNPITLCMSYYHNSGMLKHQYKLIDELPPEIKGGLHLVLVDDGTQVKVPGEAAFYPDHDLGLLSMQLFRILVDVRWNQDAARNIAVRHAETEWLLLTDMDHVVPYRTWKTLLGRNWDEKTVYTFNRKRMPNMEPDKVHPNTWFMTRKVYDAMGGYDERFAGIYGTDGDFRNRISPHAQLKHIKDDVIVYPRSVIPDASTTIYQRKQPEDDIGKRRVKHERDLAKDKTPQRYRFPYERVPQ